jgi:2-methylcitrate dehydratase
MKELGMAALIDRRTMLGAMAAIASPITSHARGETLPAGDAGRPAAPARPNIAERLADYVATIRYEDLDAATVEAAKSHLIDALGCGIAAHDEAPVRACRRAVRGKIRHRRRPVGRERICPSFGLD